MNLRKFQSPKIILNVPVGTVPLTMDMQKFFEFSFWMAEELLDLEAEFVVWQTPASTRGAPIVPTPMPDGSKPWAV